jgi:hypothetical protein
MNSDSVKAEKNAVNDGKKRKMLLTKSEDWRESCWSVDDEKKKESAVDEEEAIDLTVVG